MVFGKWQINLAKLALHIGQISSAQNVGQTFCLAHKGW